MIYRAVLPFFEFENLLEIVKSMVSENEADVTADENLSGVDNGGAEIVEEGAEKAAEAEVVDAGPEAKIAELEAALAEAKEESLRRQADFMNYRKRMQRELEDVRKLGRAGAIEQMLPIVDNFDMAMMAINQAADLETIKTGMNMIHGEISRCLDGLGVEKMDPVGQEFDPNLHEAIKTEPSEEWDEGTVVQSFKAGYKLGDKLLRAATVVVSSGAPEAAAE